MSGTKPELLYVRQLPLGPMKNFVYFVGSKTSSEIAVIDPAWDVPALLDAAAHDGKKITAVVLTHHHGDHINGVPELLNRLDVPVYVQKAEARFSEAFKAFGPALREVGAGDRITVGNADLTLVHTPGHTPGSQCVLCSGALISGDTVFVNACGRCDFVGGSPEQMFESLHQVLGALPDDTVLYPGHDYGDVPVSSLGRERAQNPYFLAKDLPRFLDFRTRPRR